MVVVDGLVTDCPKYVNLFAWGVPAFFDFVAGCGGSGCVGDGRYSK